MEKKKYIPRLFDITLEFALKLKEPCWLKDPNGVVNLPHVKDLQKKL